MRCRKHIALRRLRAALLSLLSLLAVIAVFPVAAEAAGRGVKVGVPSGYGLGSGVTDYESFLYDGDDLIPEVPERQVSEAPGSGPEIRIRQDMLSFADFAVPFTSAYRVDAVLDGETVYSDVLGIGVEDCSERIAQAGGIPEGSDVTVELLYAGPSYSLFSKQDAIVKLDAVKAGTVYTIDFGLVYDFSYRFGSGIVNPFHADPVPVVDDGSYRLPETGGTGVAGILSAGFVLMGAGLACGLSVSGRRRRHA